MDLGPTLAVVGALGAGVADSHFHHLAVHLRETRELAKMTTCVFSNVERTNADLSCRFIVVVASGINLPKETKTNLKRPT